MVHRAILIRKESDVGPFNEKDMDCYLYAMKFAGNDSQNLLLNYTLQNIYHYAMKDEVVNNDVRLERITVYASNSPVCDVIVSDNVPVAIRDIGSIVEYYSLDWLNKCYPSPPSELYLKDYLRRCGNFDRILMRQWDYLQDSNSTVILYISYNGDGRVLVTRCEVKRDYVTGEITGANCKPRRTP